MQSAVKAFTGALRRSSNYTGIISGLGKHQNQHRWISTNDGEVDSHDDFKPIHKKTDEIISVKEVIEQDVKENPVLLYMKGVPDAPQCGFSAMVTRILQAHGVPFAARNILEDQELRQAMKSFSNWPTFPQVYIKGEFVGGCDILKKMHESGELEEMLKDIPGKQ